MKVLLAAFGTRGDVQPLAALAAGLQGRGHSVTLASPPDFEGLAGALGVPFVPVGERIDRFLRRVSNPQVELVPRRALQAMPGWIRSHYAPLAPLVDRADVVVAASMTVAPLDLAERFGKRAHYVAYCPQAIPSGDHPMAFVPWQHLPRWLNRLSFWLGARGHDWSVRPHLDQEREQLGLGRSPETWDHLLFQNLVVASDAALAPLPADLRAGRWVRQPGPFFLEREDPLPAVVTRFLEAGAPPVYVGFGSMPDVDPPATEAWVRQAAALAGVRVLLQGDLDGGDDRVLGVGPLDHRALFPRCAAVVHHGGAGTTATAARAGVPQVVAPHVTDQFYWAGRLSRLGVAGPRVRPRRRDVGELAAALSAVTLDEGLQARARALSRRITQDGLGQMVALLERPLEAP